jgi:hypothetical protein
MLSRSVLQYWCTMTALGHTNIALMTAYVCTMRMLVYRFTELDE